MEGKKGFCKYFEKITVVSLVITHRFLFQITFPTCPNLLYTTKCQIFEIYIELPHCFCFVCLLFILCTFTVFVFDWPQSAGFVIVLVLLSLRINKYPLN